MKLSALEIEVLEYICKEEGATAPSVHAQIAEERSVAYSTIKTIFDRLEKKGAIKRTSRVGRTSIYASCITEENARISLLKDFIAKFFPKDQTPLFNTLIRDSKLSEKEIEYLRSLLDEKGR